jgi:hypothetical protein
MAVTIFRKNSEFEERAPHLDEDRGLRLLRALSAVLAGTLGLLFLIGGVHRAEGLVPTPDDEQASLTLSGGVFVALLLVRVAAAVLRIAHAWRARRQG